ncbi:MAG: hypothetical protein IKC13_05870 [Elusimicrobiaceae bacterium]|nr:hypothetical protein [Elusimicrobiaceae bacterium]
MKKSFPFVFIFLTACAGTPPAWWNPSGAYGGDQAVSRPQKAAPARVAVPESQPVEEEPIEQHFEPAFEEYEEMRLTPLPETDGEQEGGLAVEQTPQSPTQSQTQEEDLPPSQEELDRAQAQELNVGAKAVPSSSDADPYTSGALPPPSVLDE